MQGLWYGLAGELAASFSSLVGIDQAWLGLIGENGAFKLSVDASTGREEVRLDVLEAGEAPSGQ